MGHSRASHHPRVYQVILVVLLLSFGVFFLGITPSYTGFATYVTQNPNNVSLFLDAGIYTEGEHITGELDVDVSGPLDEQTTFDADVEGGQQESVALLEAFNYSGISFKISPREMQVKNSTASKTLVYSSQGQQLIFLKLPGSATVQQVAMDVHGSPINGSYPSFVSLDIGMDGSEEWEYLGNIVNYSSFVLPNGLNENVESSTLMKDEEAYYCEVINLPRAKDFKVHAKYALIPQAQNRLRDIEATLLSVTGSGGSVQGSGGADSCDLLDTNNTALAYYNCDLSIASGTGTVMRYAISGNHLVCVDVADFGNGTNDLYALAKDSDQGLGYRCGPISQGSTTCVQQASGDFHIKVQAAQYSGELNKRVTIPEGSTGILFEDALNNYLQSCSLQGNDCIIPIAVASDTAGLVFLENLNIRYTEGGSTSIETNFYGVSFTPGVIYEIDGDDLTQVGATFTLELDMLDLSAPTPSGSSENITVQASLTPGPYDEETILVNEIPRPNVTAPPTDPTELANFYKTLLTNLLAKHSQLLAALDYTTKINNGVQQLTTYAQQLQGVNGSNASASQQQSIVKKMESLMKPLPYAVTVPEKITSDLLVSFSDITDEVVFPDQKDEASKKKIYTLQQSTTIVAAASHYTLTTLGGQSEDGSMVAVTGSSSMGDASLILIIPSSLASSSSDIDFSVQPEVVRGSNPVILKWSSGQASSGVTLLFGVDVIGKVSQLKALMVPRVIPKEIPQERARCGDGLCSVLQVGGRTIPLEDKFTCPQDCKTAFPWVPVIVVVLIFLLVIFYVGFYKGKYNIHELLGKKLKLKSSVKGKKKLFAAPKDEISLRSYVRTSLEKGVPRTTISRSLISKGWSKQQVDYIFATLKKPSLKK